MTPEEKLLALIQQDKRQASEPVAAPPVAQKTEDGRLKTEDGRLKTEADSAKNPVNAGATPTAREESRVVESEPVPQSLKKLKLVETEEKAEVRSPKVEFEIPKTEDGRLKEEASDLPRAGSEVYGLKSKASFSSISLSPLTLLNRVLTVLVIGLMTVVFYAIMSIQPGIAKDLSLQIEGAGSMAVVPQTIVEEEVPALSLYLEKVGSRSLFASKMIPKPGDPVVIEKAGAPKDLSLVAVSMDSSSPADSMAIIKNKADSKTYFVKLGQTVGSTDYVLDRVLVDRIVLKQKKMEFELK